MQIILAKITIKNWGTHLAAILENADPVKIVGLKQVLVEAEKRDGAVHALSWLVEPAAHTFADKHEGLRSGVRLHREGGNLLIVADLKNDVNM